MTHQVEGFGTYEGHTPQYEGMTTQSLYLTMRDGVRIAAEVYLPENLSPDTRIPALLLQTRYWRQMELRAPLKWFLTPDILNPDLKDFKPFFTSHGYALVDVDVRGTGASFGTWPYPWAEDSIKDASEIVDWIVSQPWSDGTVGGHGISYVGTTAEFLAVAGHPAVKGIIAQFNHPDAYVDIAFPGGVLNERFIKMWGHFDRTLDRNQIPREFGILGPLVLKGVKPVDSDEGRQLLEAAIRSHADNGDVFEMAQKAIDFRDTGYEDIGVCMEDLAVHRLREEIEGSGVAVFGWGSWMDAGTADAVLRRFLTYDHNQRAVIGAWEHGGRFHASPYQPSNAPVEPSLPSQWGEMMRFFDARLKDVDNGVQSEKVLFYYTMGEETWKRTSVWPPEGARTQRWYLAEGHGLSPDAPASESGADDYTVDFQATSGEYNRWWEMGGVWGNTVMYPRRAEAGRRLLTYVSPPLVEDTEITGYPVVTLHVSSTHADGALYVYLEDVDERGRVTYVTEGVLRVIHRKVSEETPPYSLQVPYHSFKEADVMPLVPGEMAEITFGLLPTSALIRKGHQIRLGVAGHDEGTFVRIPQEGTPTLTVGRNRMHASFIDLPVVPRV
jgi:putative CocE/NonD family hydrolase